MDDLSLALSLADAADAIAMDRFLASDLVVETKPDMTPVSDADRAVEAKLRTILEGDRPEDAVLGEEFGAREDRLDSRREWIIDP
ncbi:MAG: inositol monophosphatase family protein, partial [Actinomycetota bacterium]|nr:inositol monophosphatase family protein [Actinomycetota bacterium]